MPTNGGAVNDDPPHRATHALTRSLVLRGLALVYFVAFASLIVQVIGLYGREGILPVASLMKAAGSALQGLDRVLELPTLFWLWRSDAALMSLCLAGLLLSVLLALGIGQRLALIGLWALYLSFMTVGDTFLGYQWDALLLEAGFIAILLAPPALRRRRRLPDGGLEDPPRLAVWLLRWLCFKLFFLSGVVKLASGDETWRGFTALEFHYWTQPIPNAIAYYVDRLPDWFQSASVVGMFVAELALPLLIFAWRWARLVAYAGLVSLQMVIGLTGNYGFFNLLAVVLACSLLDDRALRALTPRRLRPRLKPVSAVERRLLIGRVAMVLFAVLSIGLGSVQIARAMRWRGVPGPVTALSRALSPARTINSYGLFASMTTERPEILIEGSADGESWRAYDFSWKPDALDGAPPFVEPHMPRLDWQMWFAALYPYWHPRNEWFYAFVERLLQGREVVLDLLEGDPFAGTPPRWIRATLYDYTFADSEERRRTGNWWQRSDPRPFCGVMALVDGELTMWVGRQDLDQLRLLVRNGYTRLHRIAHIRLWEGDGLPEWEPSSAP